MKSELGLGVQGNRSAADYARLAAAADDYGFDVLSVFSDFMYQPAIFPLLVAAQHSKRLRLGPACLNPFTLHPVEIAGQIAALDLLSEGRAYLGLARGAWLDDAGIARRRPVRALRETIEIVRRLLSGDGTGFAGEVFNLAPARRLEYDVVRPTVPLLIGTWSPKTAALAGEVADEVKIGGTANPAMIKLMRSWIEVGTDRAGRSIDEVGIVVGAVTVVDRDGQAARRLARSAVGMYVDVVGRLDPTAEWAAGQEPSGATLDRFAMAGTPEEVTRRAQALLDAGAKRLEFGAPYGLSPETGLRLLGENVLPHLKIRSGPS